MIAFDTDVLTEILLGDFTHRRLERLPADPVLSPAGKTLHSIYGQGIDERPADAPEMPRRAPK
jgi:hypothetical protein